MIRMMILILVSCWLPANSQIYALNAMTGITGVHLHTAPPMPPGMGLAPIPGHTLKAPIQLLLKMVVQVVMECTVQEVAKG